MIPLVDQGTVTPILVVGAGRMGGALIAGWRRARAFAAAELMIRDPAPGEAAMAAVKAGARLNPPDSDLAAARTVLMAVKPQTWRAAADAIVPNLAPEAAIVSILAGVGRADLERAFEGRAVTLAMPNTAAAIGKGVTSLFAPTAEARARAHTLFSPLGLVADLADEDLMHVATAAAGSAPAYLYALIETLRDAGMEAGLPPAVAAALATGAITGAAALLDATGEDPAELRRQVTSPNGTTQAALEVLIGPGGLADLMSRAVAAAAARSRELGR